MMSDSQIKALAVGFDLLGQLRSNADNEGHLTALLIALYAVARRADVNVEEALDRVRATFELFQSTPEVLPIPRITPKGSQS